MILLSNFKYSSWILSNGSLNTFAKTTNVNTESRIICYDILDLGKQLLPIGMLVVLDSILNRITANRIAEIINKNHRTGQHIISGLKTKVFLERIGGTKGYRKIN